MSVTKNILQILVLLTAEKASKFKSNRTGKFNSSRKQFYFHLISAHAFHVSNVLLLVILCSVRHVFRYFSDIEIVIDSH